MDIVEFLTARLDEDEAAAKSAAQAAAFRDVVGGSEWVVGHTVRHEDYEFVSIRTPSPGAVEVAGSGLDGTGGVHGGVFAAHIARWDPARVLADIAAKRAIVATYKWLCETLTYPDTDIAYGRRKELERVLRLLAVPYADHPGYSPAWRVDG